MFISAPDISSRSGVRFAVAILAPSLTASEPISDRFLARNQPVSPTNLGPSASGKYRTGVDARERRLSGRPLTNSRSIAVNIAAVTIFVTFAAAALVCVVLGAHRRVVLGLRVDRAATRPLVGATHSRTMM